MTIKHNARARESMSHWADLRSGDMYQGDNEQNNGGGLVVIAVSAAISLAIFCAVFGYAMGDVPEYVPETRFEMCRGSC